MDQTDLGPQSGNPQNQEIPKWGSMGTPEIKISRNKNPQLVDLPQSRHAHGAFKVTNRKRQCRCSLMLRRGHPSHHVMSTAWCSVNTVAPRVAPHARTHMHMPHRSYRHALTQTDERHNDTDKHPLFVCGPRVGFGRARTGRDTVAGQYTVAMQRTPSQCNMEPDTVAAGAIRLSR